MTVILSLTFQQLLRRRASIFTSLFCLSPVLLAIVYRLSDPATDPDRWTARVLFSGLVVAAVLPLAALIYGISSLGNEIEDGTALYLLSKPLPRWKIVAAKILVAWLLCGTSVSVGALVAGLIVLQGGDPEGVVQGFSAALALGSLVYCALFVLLSIVTSRALIAGLVYVFLWEGLITGLFSGTRVFSVRQYCLGVADLFARASPRTFQGNLDGVESLVLMGLVAAGAALLAARRLQSFEVREKA